MTASTSFEIPKTQKVVLIDANGGYDVIKYQDNEVPPIGDNDLLIKNKYAGINFIEAYFRKGIYPTQLPQILGREATGVVVAKGQAVKDFDVGDKVAYLSGKTFAQYTKFSNSIAISKLPKDTTDEQLKLYAAALIQGLTALTFIDEAYKVKKDDYILVYAAAGGVGLILDQLLKERGAHTIAVVSTEEKAKLAKEYGAEYVIISSKEDVPTRVLEITGNKGVHAAFDSVGKDTFEATLSALRIKGTFVSYGNASGPVPPITISSLSSKNIKIVRPTLFNYIREPEEWQYYSHKLFDLIGSAKLKIKIHKVYPLSEYKPATQELEGRKTTGKLVLQIPQ